MLLLDEAKTMHEVGAYHENIINLQGIVVSIKEDALKEVVYSIYYVS